MVMMQNSFARKMPVHKTWAPGTYTVRTERDRYGRIYQVKVPKPVDYLSDNLPANRSKFLPAGGAWQIGGTPTTPGVNATFGLGISQTDLDNLRRGLVLMIFSPGHVTSKLVPHRGMQYGFAPARAYPSLANGYFRANPGISLYQINQNMSIAQQKQEQQANSSFNTDALLAVAVFVSAGYAAYAINTASVVSGTTLAATPAVPASSAAVTDASTVMADAGGGAAAGGGGAAAGGGAAGWGSSLTSLLPSTADMEAAAEAAAIKQGKSWAGNLLTKKSLLPQTGGMLTTQPVNQQPTRSAGFNSATLLALVPLAAIFLK